MLQPAFIPRSDNKGLLLQPVNLIVRMGRGRMMGVDHNRDLEWVGASAGFVS